MKSMSSVSHITVSCDYGHVSSLLKATVFRGISVFESGSFVLHDSKEKRLTVNASDGGAVSHEAISCAQDLRSLEVSQYFPLKWLKRFPQLTSLTAPDIESDSHNIVLPTSLRAISLESWSYVESSLKLNFPF